jgi:histidyl-tRNA synthetase
MEMNKYKRIKDKNMVVLDRPKGVRDFLPEQKILRDKILGILKETFEEFGYNPLETPALELLDVLRAKFLGTEADVMKEMYAFKDRGGRMLGLRYSLTEPLARVLAMNRNIPTPFKRYQMDRVWRDGPTKVGRYREFWQCDVDVIGSPSPLADAELIALASQAFKKLGLKVDIKVGSRKLLNGILKYADIPADKWATTAISLDKLDKIGPGGVEKELRDKKIPRSKFKKVLQMLQVMGEPKRTLAKLKRITKNKEYNEGLKVLEEFFGYLDAFGVKDVYLVPSLVRGLEYYTGIVFEGFLRSGKFKSSVCGGGRWDNMIGQFLGTKEIVPATGISFGLDTLYDAVRVEGSKALRPEKSVVKIFVVPIGKTTNDAAKICADLRNKGVAADMDLIGRGVSKNLDYANRFEIPYVLFVGQKELKAKKFKLRNMKSGKEELLTLAAVIKRVK